MPPKAASTSAKPKASGPSYQDMIKDAIVNLKDRAGSSRPALKKYLKANNNITATDPAFDSLFNRALKNGVEKGVFSQPKGSSGGTKLAKPTPKAAAKPAAKKPAAKKAAAKPAAKPAVKKTTVKKPTVKKAPAAKKEKAEPKEKKPAVKKAPAAKKPAAKPKEKKLGTTKVTKTAAKPKAASKPKAAPKPKAAKKA